ncbi:14282_t:CDS:2, partial [Racocetra persica]
AKRASKKLIAKLIGPFKIVQKISAVTYRLKLLETLRIHPVFYVFLLKPYYPSEFRDEVRKEPPEIATEDPEEHEVKAILDKRTYYHRLQLGKEFEKTGETVLNGGE